MWPEQDGLEETTMEEPLNFTIDTRDFDLNALDEDSRVIGTDRFAEAIAAYFASQFEPMGGRVTVGMSEKEIAVSWVPDGVSPSPLERAVSLLREGRYQEAIPLLRPLLLARPDDDLVLYNLGMAESNRGELGEAVRHLTRATEIDPQNGNALVGLSVAQQRGGDTQAALKSLERAIGLDPDNGQAHLNLGAVLGGIGRGEEGRRHLREAARLMPGDQRAMYALAYGLEQGGSAEQLAEADGLYKQTIALDGQSDLAEQARRSRSGLAQRSFRAKTEMPARMDAVMYCLSALQKFATMSQGQVQAVAFEIALLGQRGLDVNNPNPQYTLRSLPGDYSGLHLMSLMYVGFKQLAPDKDIGFDLAEEYRTAQRMLSAEKP